jgi:hypothetical protein
MANASSDLILRPYGKEGRQVEIPVGASTTIYKGTLVAQLTTGKGACPLTTALSGRCVGVAQHGIVNASSLGAARVIVENDCVVIMDNDGSNAVSESDALMCTLYATDDHTVSSTNTGSDPVAGYFAGLEPDSRVRVYIEPTDLSIPPITDFSSATHDHEDAAGGGQITPADAFDAAVPATLGGTGQTTTTAGDVLYGAAGNTISKLPIGTANQVLTVNAGATAPEWANTLDPDLKGTIEIALGDIYDADGDRAKFANAGADGVTITDSKAVCYRINDSANPPHNLCGFVVPADADVTANMTLKFLVSKSGNTDADDTTITVEAFNQVAGALHDADDDYGGTTNALVGNAAAKTLTTLSLTLALANLPAVGSGVSLTFHPTDGTLGTDDLLIHRIWVEYTKKLDA